MRNDFIRSGLVKKLWFPHDSDVFDTCFSQHPQKNTSNDSKKPGAKTSSRGVVGGWI